KKYRNKIIVLRGFSHEIIKQWPRHRNIDFLWIDGDHSYEGVKKDIHDWIPLVKKDSFICFHDYRDAPGVKKAVDELMNAFPDDKHRLPWRIRKDNQAPAPFC
ncbi:class I SAM-dependent methyltransferase, partial [Candidatus Omnitrophota bacterium]